MSLLSFYSILSLSILCKLVTVQSYTYQTKPLFLSFSELAALEANSLPQTNNEDPAGAMTAAGDDEGETFVVKCHEDSIEVVIKAPLFGLRVEPTQLRLGPVSAAQDHCTSRVSGDGKFTIRAPLAECGNQVMFTDSAVIYSNLLLYFPPPLPPPSSPGDTVLGMGAAIPVQCEYSRRYTVSSRALTPTWSPHISVQTAHLSLDFHLRLMTNDWSRERNPPVYFLGELVNMEASVDHHPLPLRLYVGGCVATLTPDVNSNPRYPFIDHQGCFTDSQLSSSRSRFLPRVQNEILQIQLEPFLFHQDHRHTIYISCHLEAVPLSKKDPEKKACSFINGSWRSVDDDHHLCESCDSTEETSHSRSSHKRALKSRREARQHEVHKESTVGPILFLPRKADISRNHKYLY